jgi:hypothetical protein
LRDIRSTQEFIMRKVYPLVTLLCIFLLGSFAFGREAKLVRYPSYSNGRIAGREVDRFF